MTKPQILDLIKLLSALESWSFSIRDARLPAHLLEQLTQCMEVLEGEVLK